MVKRILLGLVLAAGSIAAAISTTPRIMRADEFDRCGGTSLPVCRKVEVCAQVPGTDIKQCDRNYYYFPAAE